VAEFVEVYGLKVPKGTPKLALELQCYRTAHGPADGGLGTEQHFKNAYHIMWPNYEWSDWVEMLIQAWCRYKWISVIGHRRASKSFTSAHIAWLDYCANPYMTLTSFATVTFEGLRLRMWSDLLRAIETSAVQQAYQVRSTTNELRVYPESASHESGEKFQIQGMAVNHTQDAAGRIKGGHAPRRRLFLDEAEDIDAVIFDAMGNPMSAPDARCVMLANPVEKVSKFGDFCEPEGGWSSVRDTDLSWVTKKGGICLHFDGLQSPNMRGGTKIFTGILSRADVEETRKNHGEDSVEWWSQIRGWFPPDGLVNRIFPSGVIEKAKPPIIFDFRTEPVATLDPAFEHDACAMHFGDKGALRDGRYAISGTQSENFRFKSGDPTPKDFQIAYWVRDRCKQMGVTPKNFIMDRSGGGRGVFAILQKEWSRDVQGIDYGGAATERPVTTEDIDKCCDVYEKFVTELWFRARVSCEEGILGGLSNLNPLTADDLYSRRYFTKKKTQGTVQVAETKDELKARLGRSPDCFVAGTVISTPNGDKPIEWLRAGDLVTTPMGDQTIEEVISSETSELWAIRNTYGRELVGKGSHRIFTWNRGWVRLDSLSLTDEIESIKRIGLWNLLNAFFTKDESFAFKRRVDITKPIKRISKKDFYIGLSGFNTLAQSLQNCVSIIGTGIGKITESKIWNWWSVPSTVNYTFSTGCYRSPDTATNSWPGFLLHEKQLRHGTPARKDWNGTDSMDKRPFWRGEKTSCRKTAKFAKSSSSLSGSGQNSVQKPADQSRGLLVTLQKLSRVFAQFAVAIGTRPLKLTQKPARLNATHGTFPRSGKRIVFNLRVANHNVYYANGMLVENCGDAFTQFGELLIREGHGPGRAKKGVTADRWANARRRAVLASQRYGESAEGFQPATQSKSQRVPQPLFPR